MPHWIILIEIKEQKRQLLLENFPISWKSSDWSVSLGTIETSEGAVLVIWFNNSNYQNKNAWFHLGKSIFSVTFSETIPTLCSIIPVTISYYLLLPVICWQFLTAICCSVTDQFFQSTDSVLNSAKIVCVCVCIWVTLLWLMWQTILLKGCSYRHY